MATYTCNNSLCINKTTSYVEYETKGIKIDNLVDTVNNEIETLQTSISERKDLLPMNGDSDKLSILVASALDELSSGVNLLSKGYVEKGIEEDLKIAESKHKHEYNYEFIK